MSAGHGRRYPALVVSLLVVATLAVTSVFAFGRDGHATSYLRGLWVAGQVAAWAFGALALIEAASRCVEGYVEFRRVAERIVRVGLFVSGLVVGGWLLFASPDRIATFGRFFNAHTRITLLSLAALGAATWAFVRLAGLRLSPNAALSLRILTLQFSGSAIVGWDLLPGGAHAAFLAGLVWTTGCATAGALGWRMAEEPISASNRRSSDSPDSDDARRALAALRLENERLRDVLKRE